MASAMRKGLLTVSRTSLRTPERTCRATQRHLAAASATTTQPHRQFDSTDTRSQMTVGQSEEFDNTFTATDAMQFCELTLDANPLCLDPDYAAIAISGQPAVSGFLRTAIFGTMISKGFLKPGSIIKSLSAEYPCPLFVGEPMTAKVEVTEIEGRKATIALKSWNKTSKKVVAQGTAIIILPKQSEKSI